MDIEKIKKQFESSDLAGLDWATIAQLASLVSLEKVDRSLYEAIVAEFCAQESTLKMIASENYSSLPVQLAMGNWMTDKYAEGSVGHRFYSGCHNVDLIEEEASSLAKKLFQSEAAYVQPHSGSDANLIAYAVLLQKAVEGPFCTSRGKSLMELSAVEFESMRKQWMDCAVLGMDLSSGGHLTHGFRANLSGKLFRSFTYGVDPTTGWIDYDEVEKKALEVRPAILIAGYSSYPRRINFRRMKEIANRVGAFLLADMAHFAGFVAAGLFQGDENPILHADLVTSTTHKTLRGPRGGIILGKKEFESVLLRGCPLVQGGPLPHVMAAKGIAFREALQPEREKP